MQFTVVPIPGRHLKNDDRIRKQEEKDIEAIEQGKWVCKPKEIPRAREGSLKFGLAYVEIQNFHHVRI